MGCGGLRYLVNEGMRKLGNGQIHADRNFKKEILICGPNDVLSL